MVNPEVRSAAVAAERQFRDLMAASAMRGEYETVVKLSAVACQLSQLAADAGGGEAGPLGTPASTAGSMPAHKDSQAGREPTRPTRRQNYPRFERDRTQLVKVGWSKKERREYIHRAPRTGLMSLARRVAEVGKASALFGMADIMPVRLEQGEELPAYQSYLCFAWLRQVGAIKQLGRRGYSLAGEDPSLLAERLWDRLPQAGDQTHP